MFPKYDLGTGVAWPETLELEDRDPVAYPNDGLKGSSFPMHVNIAVAEGGTVCSVDLDREAATTLHGWLTECLAFIGSTMDAVPDPGYVESETVATEQPGPDTCERCGGKGCLQCGLEPFVRGAMSGQRARR